MKRVPLTIIPLIILGIFAYLFKYVVPVGGDLISDPIDTVLGIIVGALLVVCLFYDVSRFTKMGKMPSGAGMGTGIAVGVAIGVALKNIAIGIAIGIALGTAFDVGNKEKK